MVCGSGGSKSRLAKAAGAEPSGQIRDDKIARRCGTKHISKSECTRHTILGTLLEAVVARSTFRSQNVQNRTKHTNVGAVLEVEMSNKCTPLWREIREAHFEVKMYRTPHVRATFGGSDVVSRGRRKGLCTLSKVSKT